MASNTHGGEIMGVNWQLFPLILIQASLSLKNRCLVCYLRKRHGVCVVIKKKSHYFLNTNHNTRTFKTFFVQVFSKTFEIKQATDEVNLIDGLGCVQLFYIKVLFG